MGTALRSVELPTVDDTRAFVRDLSVLERESRDRWFGRLDA